MRYPPLATTLGECQQVVTASRRVWQNSGMEPRPPLRHGLAWLLDPIPVEDFFGSYMSKRPLAVQRSRPDYYKSWPSLEDVDALITATVYVGRDQSGRLVRTGKGGEFTQRPFRQVVDNQPDIHDIYRAYGDGFTVVLNGIEGRSPIIGSMCRQLENDFQHRIGANIYLTPRGAQGARPHIDSHDVILAQMHGTKRWRIATELTPADQVRREGRDSVEIREAQEWLLQPGDALYIPKGFAHAGVADDAASLHLTFGITVLTWADLLIESIRIRARDNTFLGQALPVGHLNEHFDAQSVQLLSDQFSKDSIAQRLDEARVSLGSQLLTRQEVTRGHFPSLDQIGDLTSETRLVRGFDGPVRLLRTEDSLTAEFPGNYVSVPLALAPALEYCATHRTLRVGDLTGDLSTEQSVEFVARMIREGFLDIDKETD